MAKYNYKDLTGQTFGKLTVLRRNGSTSGRSRRALWLCQCECGNTVTLDGYYIRRGRTDCGCITRVTAETHGHTKGGKRTPTYVSWNMAIQRCTNPNMPFYEDYGGRGITFYEEWRRDFQKFLDYAGERPDGLTLDRIDSDGNYEPGNIRWATRKQQQLNRRKRRNKKG